MLVRYTKGDRNNSPVAAAEVPEAQGLLGRKINHDEAVGTGLSGVLQHLLLAIAQQGVVVSHEENWGLETALPRIANHLKDIVGSNAVLEGLLQSKS